MAMKVFDTKYLYVCVCDDSYVSVFVKKEYYYATGGRIWYGGLRICRGMKFADLLSERVAFYHAVCTEPVPLWVQRRGHTIATCNMTKAVPFENVRFDLKRAGKIGEFNPGQATLSEIYKVLEFAPQYLGLTQEQEKTKEKL